MAHKHVLDIFNSIVTSKFNTMATPDLSLVHLGVVTDFKIIPAVKEVIEQKYPALPMNTLFGREERLTSSPIDLLTKQILHYIEVYGLSTPGLFNLVQNNGTIIKGTFIKAITTDELAEKIHKIIYTNAPIKDVEPFIEMIRAYNITYNISEIKNNELRVRLFNIKKDVFTNGDDAVRYIVYNATNEMLVIKNKAQIAAVKASTISEKFLNDHRTVLSEVFNRFKPIILALKNKSNATVINKIARMSKLNHKPVYEGFNKRALSEGIKAIAGNTFEKFTNGISRLTVRDKFKILNLIEYKRMGYSTDSFVIRNGTVHIEKDRKILNPLDLDLISDVILESLKQDFDHLKVKNILLDERVDYGLPISRKQTFGNLPFGTLITVDGEISSGIYWENAWGARDLDLSTVDLNGRRTGWGSCAAYGNIRKGDVVFSGDVTHAENGAMEFMTSTTQNFGLFVNIFAGNPSADFEMIVGTSTNKTWMDNVVVRERSTLNGRGSVVGFVQGNKFKVFQGKLNDRHANFKETNPVLNRVLVDTWTVSKLLDRLDIQYDLDPRLDVEYDFNLSYNSFSIDKLEDLLLN